MRLSVDSVALNDMRIKRLARRMGINYFEALGRLTFVWHEVYVLAGGCLSLDDIDIAAGLDGFAAAMLDPTVNLAEERPEGTYIRGSSERTKWVVAQQQKSRAGGEATKQKWEEIVSKATNEGPGAWPGAGPEASPQPGPEASPQPGPGLGPQLGINPTQPNPTKNSEKRSKQRRPAQADLELPGPPESEPPKRPDHTAFVRLWSQLFEGTHGVKYDWTDTREFKHVQGVLAHEGGLVEAERRARYYLGPLCPAWMQTGRDLKGLLANWNKLAAPPSGPPRDVRIGHVAVTGTEKYAGREITFDE